MVLRLSLSSLRQQHLTVLLPFPMTRVNCPAMSPSEMGVAEDSPSQGGVLWDWKASDTDSFSAPVFGISDGELAESVAGCAALGGV